MMLVISKVFGRTRPQCLVHVHHAGNKDCSFDLKIQ